MDSDERMQSREQFCSFCLLFLAPRLIQPAQGPGGGGWAQRWRSKSSLENSALLPPTLGHLLEAGEWRIREGGSRYRWTAAPFLLGGGDSEEWKALGVGGRVPVGVPSPPVMSQLTFLDLARTR